MGLEELQYQDCSFIHFMLYPMDILFFNVLYEIRYHGTANSGGFFKSVKDPPPHFVERNQWVSH